MAASVALITGDGLMQEHTVRHFGFALWSAAFKVVLQKRGWISVDVFGPDILDAPARLDAYDLIIVCWLPGSGLSPRAVETLLTLGRPTLIEGPLATDLAGICRILGEPRSEVIAGSPALLIEDPLLLSDIRRLCPHSLGDDAGRLILEQKALVTRQSEFDFIGARRNAASFSHMESAASEALISLMYGLKRRFERLGHFFEDDAGNLRMCLALQSTRERLDEGLYCDQFRAFIDRAIEIMLERTEGNNAKQIAELRAGLRDPRRAIHLRGQMADGKLAEAVKAAGGETVEDLLSRVRFANLSQVMMAIGELAAEGCHKLAEALFIYLRDRCYDVEKGAFWNCIIKNGRMKVGQNYCMNPALICALAKIAGPIRMLHAPSVMGNMYDENIVDAWQRAPLIHQRVKLESGCVLGRFEWDDGPAIFKYRNLCVLSFSALSWLVYYHTIGLLEDSYFDAASLGFMAMEELVFLLLRRMSETSCNPIPQIAPWPWGYDYAFCIRHDVDRIPDQKTFDRLMTFHRENGLAVSWYWLPWRLDREQMDLQQSAGHEIALHAVRTFEKKEEIGAIEAALSEGNHVAGETYHGTAADFWLGAPTVQCSADANLLYTELAPNMFQFPYSGYPRLNPDGRVSIEERVVGLTQNASVDLGQGMQRKSNLLGRPGLLSEWISRGHQIILLNHPDINFDRLASIISNLPKVGRLDWTARQIAEWWRKTHDMRYMRVDAPVRTERGYRMSIQAKEPVSDLRLTVSGGDHRQTRAVYQDDQNVEWNAWEESRKVDMRLNLRAGETSLIEIEAEF